MPLMTEHRGRVITSKDGFEIISCDDCSYVHQMPLPTPEEIKALYEQEFYAEVKKDYIAKHESEQDYWVAIYTERLEKMKELMGLEDKLRSVVDVGCGPGYFMKAARLDGWEVMGIELSKQAAEHARQFGQVMNVTVEDIDYPPNLCHAIHCSFLLEHLANPLAVLKKLHGWLAPGGVICIEVPRDDSMAQAYAADIVVKYDWWIAPKEGHCNYFKQESLINLMDSAGFRLAHETTTMPMEAFLVGGRDYLGNPEVGSECHKQRMALEMYMYQNCPELKKGLYQLMAQHELGREIILYGQKDNDNA